MADTLSSTQPKVTRTYQNHSLDSTRWHHYRPRDDDVIVATSYKSGTTWTLNIVRRLIFLDQEVPPYNEIWIDTRFMKPVADMIAELEAQQHRRYIKTHLALDGLPYYPQVKYIVVGRDARDVFMSFWNHYRSLPPEFLERVNALPGRIGPPIPSCPEDIHQAWHNWISRGWFAWEQEGYPWWGNMHNVQSWWNFRHLDNILFVHFNDLLANLPEEIKQIANFLGLDLPEAVPSGMLQALSLDNMRTEAATENPNWARAFFFKGANGRWREVLSAEEVALYDKKAAEVLTPECRAWLERGQAGVI